MSYKFVENLSVADVAFVADGVTLEEMFESAAIATTNVMIRNIKKIELKKQKNIALTESSVEKLLFNFLQEIVYLKDAEQLVFGKYELNIQEGKDVYSLSCKASGEKVDMKKHELVADVKAVTYHKFEVKKEGNKWKSQVILDI